MARTADPYTHTRSFARVRASMALRLVWILALGVLVLLPAQAFATTVSLMPNGDVSIGGGWVGCSQLTLADCLDDPTPHVTGTSDADTAQANINSTTIADFDLGTVALGGTNLTQVQFRLRGQCTSGGTTGTTTLRLYNQGGSPITAAVNVSTNSTMTSYAPAAVTPTSTIDQTVLDDAFVRVTSPACTFSSNRTYAALAVDVIGPFPAPPTITGNARDTTGAAWGPCDNVTANVGVIVQGGAPTFVACDDLTGAYASTAAFTGGQTVTTFLNGTGGGTNGGATYRAPILGSGTPITMDIDQGRARLEEGTALTNAMINQNDSADDADIPVTGTTFSGTFYNAQLLQVSQNTAYVPGSAVTAPRIAIHTGVTWTAGAQLLALTGSGTASCATPLNARPFCNSGTFAAGTGVVRYSGTSATAVAGATYYMLQLHPASGSPVYDLGTADAPTIAALSLDVGNGTNAMTASTTVANPTINITGSLTVANTSILTGSGTGTMTIGGGITAVGSITLTNGTVALRGTGAASINANGADAPVTFGTLEVSTTSGIRTITLPASTQPITTTQRLQVGRTGEAVTTLNGSAFGQVLTVQGDFEIHNGGSIAVPPATTLHGNMISAGTFTPGTGTFTIAGTGTTSITNAGGSGSFYRLTSSAPGKTIELGSTGIPVTNQLNLTGGTCSAPLILRSTVPGMQRTLTTTGAAFTLTNVAVGDVAMSTAATANGSSDLGNTSGITFAGAPLCAAPTNPYSHHSNASSGFVKPTAIDGASAFHMSVQNAMGVDADRIRTTIRSTALDSNVKALWTFDGGSLADKSTTNGPLINPTGTTLTNSHTGFGRHATFNGVNNYLYTAPNPAYPVHEFTIETWFSSTTVPAVQGILAAHAASSAPTDQHAAITLQANSTIIGVVLNTSGAPFAITAPAAALFDGAWHHTALTVDGTKTVRLYVDGVQVGSTTYTGTLNAPAVGWALGGHPSFSTSYFTGSLDDIQLSDRALPADEIAGYYATNRPHYETIWTNGPTGQTIACADTDRCADVAYAGPNIHVNGARYYAEHQLRTTGGAWSGSVSDWFETRNAITIVAPASMTLTAVTPGTDATTSGTVTTTCLNPTGCTISASSASDTVALTHTVSSSTIPPASPASPAAPGPWPVGGMRGLGATVLTTTSTKNPTRWGTGTTFSPLTDLNYQGLTTTPSMLVTTTTPGTETTSLGLRINPPGPTEPGSYSGQIQVIAVPNL